MSRQKIKIEYTSAGFEQDSNQAMKNDLIRALIELITNCDDAYARADRQGSIKVIVRRAATREENSIVTVQDKATGVPADQMKNSFTVLGGDLSGFASGKDVRGLFSRGSKDTAWFGQTLFESVCDDSYSVVLLRSDGQGEFESVRAKPEHRKALHLADGENGLSASISIARLSTKIPELRDLVEKISCHVQLRQIVSRHSVVISEFRDGKLMQEVPAVWTPPPSSELFSGIIKIPSYDCSAVLKIRKLETRSEGPVTEYSEHGIEVRGRRAVYMNTLFSLSSTGTALICGEVECEMIDELIRDFGKSGEGDAKNPLRLVSRSRDGLEPSHPFMQALTAAVVEVLKPILENLEPKASELGGESFKKSLSVLGRLLAEEMKQDLEDEVNDGVGGQVPTTSNPIVLIPPLIVASRGSKRTLSILVHEDSLAMNGVTASSSSDCCGLVGKASEFQKHPVFPGVAIGRLQLEMREEGYAVVSVFAMDDREISATATVSITDDYSIEQPPSTLEWRNSSMSVGVGKTRSITLRAPIDEFPNGTADVTFQLVSESVKLETPKSTIRLIGKGWLEGRVRISGLAVESKGSKIVASADDKIAEGLIRVTSPTSSSGPLINIVLVDQFAGPSRGRLDSNDEGMRLTIYGRHKGLSNYLGTVRKDGGFSRESEPETLAVVSEIAASVAADYSVRRQVTNDPQKFRDIDGLIFLRTKIVDRYLRILVEGASAASRS